MPPIAHARWRRARRCCGCRSASASEEAARIALAGGLDVVMNRCVKIEHARVMGGLHWAGVNTGVISARRRRERVP
jgi:hypothetical protein